MKSRRLVDVAGSNRTAYLKTAGRDSWVEIPYKTGPQTRGETLGSMWRETIGYAAWGVAPVLGMFGNNPPIPSPFPWPGGMDWGTYGASLGGAAAYLGDVASWLPQVRAAKGGLEGARKLATAARALGLKGSPMGFNKEQASSTDLAASSNYGAGWNKNCSYTGSFPRFGGFFTGPFWDPFNCNAAVNDESDPLAWAPHAPLVATLSTPCKAFNEVRGPCGPPWNWRIGDGYSRPADQANNPIMVVAPLAPASSMRPLRYGRLTPLAVAGLAAATMPHILRSGEMIGTPSLAMATAAVRLSQAGHPLFMSEHGPATKGTLSVPARVQQLQVQTAGRVGNPPPTVRFTPSDHQWRNIAGRREKKVKMNPGGMFRALMGAFTETADFIEAIHGALPKHLQRSRTWKGADGKWHRKLVSSMMRDLVNNWEKVDITQAMRNVVANEIQDQMIGMMARKGNKAGNVLGFGGQGFTTTLGKVYDRAGVNITAPSGWVKSAIEGKE